MDWRRVGRWFVFVWFALGGMAHFIWTDAMASIVPDVFAAPRLWVVFTGACELLGAAGLLHRRLRPWAGLGLAVLAVCVTPANLHMGLHAERYPWIGGPLLWLRIAFQPVLIWVIWRSADVPAIWRRRHREA